MNPRLASSNRTHYQASRKAVKSGTEYGSYKELDRILSKISAHSYQSVTAKASSGGSDPSVLIGHDARSVTELNSLSKGDWKSTASDDWYKVLEDRINSAVSDVCAKSSALPAPLPSPTRSNETDLSRAFSVEQDLRGSIRQFQKENQKLQQAYDDLGARFMTTRQKDHEKYLKSIIIMTEKMSAANDALLVQQHKALTTEHAKKLRSLEDSLAKLTDQNQTLDAKLTTLQGEKDACNRELNAFHATLHQKYDEQQGWIKTANEEIENTYAMYMDAQNSVQKLQPLVTEVEKLQKELEVVRQSAEQERTASAFRYQELACKLERHASHNAGENASTTAYVKQLEKTAENLKQTIRNLSELYRMEKDANDGLRRLRDELLQNPGARSVKSKDRTTWQTEPENWDSHSRRKLGKPRKLRATVSAELRQSLGDSLQKIPEASSQDEALPSPKFLTREGLHRLERVLLEDGLKKAIAKLNWILPFKLPPGTEWKRLEDLSGSLNTSLLHDVVIDTVGQVSGKNAEKNQPSAAARPAVLAAERAMNAMYGHVFSREVLQRNIDLGKAIHALATAGLTEHDLPEEERFATIQQAIAEKQDTYQREEEAKVYKDERRIDAEAELQKVSKAVEDAKNQLAVNMEAWRLHEKQTDNEVYETNARVAVELDYTEDFAEHQLQYINFAREYEEKQVADARLKASREAEYLRSVHKGTMDIFRNMSDHQRHRHHEAMDVAQTEQDILEAELRTQTKTVENLENDLACVQIALQHHEELINDLRSRRAEEIVREQELARLLNAIIRIQRWWRWRLWKMSKKKKKGKGKKGKKGKGKSKGKAKKGKKK